MKREIRELLRAYHARRFELGMKPIQLQDMLAHYGKGTFNMVAMPELKIQHSTVYDLIDYARAKRNHLESLSGKRANRVGDTDVDLNDPEDMAAILREFGRYALKGHSGFSSLYQCSGDANESIRQASSIGSLC